MHFGKPFICKKAAFCESAQILMCLHSVNLFLIFREDLRFLKNHRNGSSNSLYKIDGRSNLYRRGGGQHCFSLVIFGHCGNNALYSASLSFMFILLLTPFDTEDCYYFKSNLRVVLLVKMFLTKKLVMLFCSLLNVKKCLPSSINFLD